MGCGSTKSVVQLETISSRSQKFNQDPTTTPIEEPSKEKEVDNQQVPLGDNNNIENETNIRTSNSSNNTEKGDPNKTIEASDITNEVISVRKFGNVVYSVHIDSNERSCCRPFSHFR